MQTAEVGTIITTNPATEEELGRYSEFTDAQMDRALDAAVAAQRSWAQVAYAERSAVVRAVAGVLRERKAGLAALITAELGKPITESEAEIEKCARAPTPVSGPTGEGLTVTGCRASAAR